MLLGTSVWGSTIRYLTWKVKDTPAGRLVFRLAVSRPDTKGKESGWWPTPDTQNYRDGTKLRNPEKQNRSPGTRWGMSLHHAVAMFPTITRTDAMKGGSVSPRPQGMGLSETLGGRISPDWAEALMGYPPGWTSLDDGQTDPGKKESRE